MSRRDCSEDMKDQRKTIRLVHNPAAGKEDNDDEGELCQQIKSHGHQCKVVQKKDALKKINPQTDLIAIAGGDGTVRSAVIALLEKKLCFKRPIAILPQGTANNIANSLGIPLDPDQAIALWQQAQLKKFDVGMLMGLARKPLHFIESTGFGLFPALMEKMDKKKDSFATAEEEIETALKELRKLALKFAPKTIELITSAHQLKKQCIMVEVMNIRSIGPRLELSPDSEPGDGLLEVIMITNDQRQELIDFIDGLLQGKKTTFPIKPIVTNKLDLRWEGKRFHIDDQLMDYAGQNLCISVLENLIEVVVNPSN